jgi:threonine dehydrogenase-like Zn-dependent dehydrogenase
MEDPALGALIEPLAVGFHGAHQADIDASSKVLVIGAGPIGQASALAARYRGASSISVIEPNPVRAAVVEGLGFSVFPPDSLGDEVFTSLNGSPSFNHFGRHGDAGGYVVRIQCFDPGAEDFWIVLLLSA